jgi:GNAT superfamily N-acetyltransferase
MQERRENNFVVSLLHGVPGPQLIAIFKQAFRAHPAALLSDELTLAFLSAFAQRATFLVARNPVIGAELGFAIGGDAAVLDRIRVHFIRRHGWRLAGSILGRRLSARVLLARVRVRTPIRGIVHAPYQLRFIAVEPQARGMGLGAMLLAAFEATLPPGSTYHAWTLEGSHGAEKFYLGNGFTRAMNVKGHLRMWKRL